LAFDSKNNKNISKDNGIGINKPTIKKILVPFIFEIYLK